MAGHAQSFRVAGSETTGDGLEATARKLTERSLLGANGTGASLPQFTVRDGCQVLTPQKEASDTCTSTVPSLCLVLSLPGTVQN